MPAMRKSLVSVNSQGGNAEVTFNVKTSCTASQGKFQYSFASSERPGVRSVRTVPMWSASKGKAFTWTDEFRDASAISDVQVMADSVESTKL
jgi:hypothetical protein